MGQRYGNGNGNNNGGGNNGGNGNRGNTRQGGGGDNGGGNGGGKSPPTHDLVLVAKDQEGKYAIVKEFNQQAGMDTSVRLGALWITDLDGNPLKDIKIFGRIGPENGEREAVRGMEIRPRDGQGSSQGSNGGNSGGGNSGGNRGGNNNGGGQGGAPAQQSRGNYGGGNRSGGGGSSNSGNGRSTTAQQQAPRQQQQSGSRFDD